MLARRFLITGRVQGVGFRYSMTIEARRLGLAGWVRNCRDGSVEAVASGEEAALDALGRWARRGPSAARVAAVDMRVATADESEGLETPFDQR
jgi:acylphosphatase